MYYSVYYINLLMTAFLTIFRRFSTTFRRFPKIFQNCLEDQTNFPEHFPRISENSRRFPKISEDCRRLPKTFEEEPKMFRWYTNELKYTWYHRSHRYLHMWRYHIFTCEDIVSFLSICYHSLYHWLLYNKALWAIGGYCALELFIIIIKEKLW